MIFDLSKDFSCEIKRPLSTKDRNETAKFWKRFFGLFWKMWKMGAIYKVDKLRKRADSCLISMSILKKDKIRLFHIVTNFSQLISPQPVDWFSQTKLRWKAPNEGYPHICGMYKSNNEKLRYQAISSYKSFIC